MSELNERSEELLDALSRVVGNEFGRGELLVDSLHTGGGVFVAAVDLSLDGRFMGRQIWLTRDGANEWLVGLYDFAADPEDEGLCVAVRGTWDQSTGLPYDPDDPCCFTSNRPLWVAGQVAGILARLGVTKLQGE